LTKMRIRRVIFEFRFYALQSAIRSAANVFRQSREMTAGCPINNLRRITQIGLNNNTNN
jgi:hypothetical protein